MTFDVRFVKLKNGEEMISFIAKKTKEHTFFRYPYRCSAASSLDEQIPVMMAPMIPMDDGEDIRISNRDILFNINASEVLQAIYAKKVHDYIITTTQIKMDFYQDQIHLEQEKKKKLN